jgi:hypothetical protein
MEFLLGYYCAVTAAEDGHAENLKHLSVGSSGSVSRRRAVIIERFEPCSRDLSILVRVGKSAIAEPHLREDPEIRGLARGLTS